MNKTQIALLITAIVSLTLVGIALYFQLEEDMLPCPLCIIQRYAFILLAIGSLIGVIPKDSCRKIGCAIGLYASISGASVALHHLYVTAHPEVSCGIDPVQRVINELPFANWFPALFSAWGVCGTYYDPILGLSMPQWSFIWFALFTVVLLSVLFKAKSVDKKG
ncbi:MAG: disulfide bond formation protein [Solimicrobium sp.]|jgi:disulfide bond formation protein DsbB|nr:disulfide bond formation protein [Solimicrobium sp.]